MDQFHFGVGKGRVSDVDAQRIAKIARKHDATFSAETRL
jgi:hypothetical protein